MKSRIASVRAAGGLDRVNCAVQLLEDEWQRHGEVQLKRFWNEPRCRAAVDSVSALEALAELVKADLRCRFDRGQTPAVAEYLEQFPELREADTRVLSLVYEEYCLNEERGNAPDVESFCDRYPDWKRSLLSQLEYHRLFSEAAGGRTPPPRFPEAGQVFEVFRLQSLLGKGGMSRVFLAKDLSLGGKQVVLKVALDRGQEPQVQGSLEHPHIVPVNSVVYAAEGDLCGLSMPYRPGLPLDEVIARVDPAKRPKKAIALWRALVVGTADSARAETTGLQPGESPASAIPLGPRGDGWEGFPASGTYPQGVAWLIMIVARALHYAHTKKTFHRDVKPANILLTLQSGPQLLDFNLAESPHSADHAQDALHGGTLPYMSPEQIEAFINPELWDRVGAQADTYSLGLVLRELLTGQKPEVPDRSVSPARALRAVLDHRPLLDTSARRANPAVPFALEAIVAKCLTMSCDTRYASAKALAEDLQLFLERKPLKHAVNPSRRERVQNWAVRHRRVLRGIAACLLLLGGVCSIVAAVTPVRIENTKGFASAVRSFDAEKTSASAIKQFKALEAVDPDSPLLKFYLGFAHRALEPRCDPDKSIDADKRYTEADRYVRDALGKSSAERLALAWYQDHPKLSAYLVDFADSRLLRADNTAKRHDDGSGDKARDLEIRGQTYEMTRKVLILAEKLNPKCVRTQRLLAKTEGYFDEHERAYERLTHIIGGFPTGFENDVLFNTRVLRIWVAGSWAADERERQADDGETLKRLREAARDFEFCDRYLSYHNFGKFQYEKRYYVLQHSLRAMVAMAEVELDLSRWQDARDHLAESEYALSDLTMLINSNQLKVGTNEKLENRLDEAWSRVTAEEKRSTLLATGEHIRNSRPASSPK